MFDAMRSTLFLLMCWVLTSYGNTLNGYVRKVVEGSQVTIMCRIPISSDQTSQISESFSADSLTPMPVIWVRFDMKDPSNHMVISHGNTLLVDNSRLQVTFEEDTGKSILTIDQVQSQDGGSYQCQVPNETESEVVSSPPIEIVVENAESAAAPLNSIFYHSLFTLVFLIQYVLLC